MQRNEKKKKRKQRMPGTGYEFLRRRIQPKKPDPEEVLASLPFKPRHDSYSIEGPDGVMVFRPTLEEMRDFTAYINFMEAVGADQRGIAKVIAPPEYTKGGFDVDRFDQMLIRSPIEQLVSGTDGRFCVMNVEKKDMTVQQFRSLANSSRHTAPAKYKGKYDELERYFWRNLAFNSAIYGADVAGTVTNPDQKVWNINKLGTILDVLGEDTGLALPGVNTAYLYFGMWKAAFCWHTEDKDLYSINYIHHGAEKQWYGIPPAASERMYSFASRVFHGSARQCKQFLRHKMFLITPTVLKNNNIPVYKTVHHAGEFMITFPSAYHAGYNLGFNIAESTNFATDRWIEHGLLAESCRCHSEFVHIDMDVFLRRYRPSLWAVVEEHRAAVEAQRSRQRELDEAERRLEMGIIDSSSSDGGSDGGSDDGSGSSSGSDDDDDDEGVNGQRGRKRAVASANRRRRKTTGTKKTARSNTRGENTGKRKADARPEQQRRVDSKQHRIRQAWQKRFALERVYNHRVMEQDSAHSGTCCVCGDRGVLPRVACLPGGDHDDDDDHDGGGGGGGGGGVGASHGSSDGHSRSSAGHSKTGGAVLAQARRSKHPWNASAVALLRSSISRTGTRVSRMGNHDHGGEHGTNGGGSGDDGEPRRKRAKRTLEKQQQKAVPDLLVCQSCLIAVHPGCYGADMDAASCKSWLCDRCRVDATRASCVLCPKLGGALKPVSPLRPKKRDDAAAAPPPPPPPSAPAAVTSPAGCSDAKGEVGGAVDVDSLSPLSNASMTSAVSSSSSLAPTATASTAVAAVSSSSSTVASSDGGKRVCGRASKRRQWAHLLCAYWVPEVVFEAPNLNVVDVSAVPRARQRLRCSLCKNDPTPLPRDLWQDSSLSLTNPPKTSAGAPVQCCKGRCVTAFHVSCAFRAGLPYTFHDGNFGFYCARHAPASGQQQRRTAPVNVGDRVRAKWQLNHFFEGMVVDISIKGREVNVEFDDGSTCVMPLTDVFLPSATHPDENLSLRSKHLSTEGRPAVKVLWEGEMLDATIINYVNINKYSVLFDDGYSATLPRSDVYLLHERLPPRAKLHVVDADERDSSGDADDDDNGDDDGAKDNGESRRSRGETSSASTTAATGDGVSGRGRRRRNPPAHLDGYVLIS
ncbi:hypothetical protein PTSG_08936 [Salpingoeca rosetta]|uniref:[histone H3]-trimethyl-L-lysine(9) demethylase n=1 Tax=Salpingoeca rosetta (strain ATCC 50818 / BSB-021) TaxID=946362 RepID=F2ULQ9_SALR5|nr:uncharacterized protein PTSG_08936 [Salpingoeca rosetta]EGD78058.1 hypothetical protein PTSG_08936 [Salpingoeca rosetta]|eukprot:XP_004989734.1 hypothetical protein PTSG_08936 [Salpingoeca rosetta]